MNNRVCASERGRQTIVNFTFLCVRQTYGTVAATMPLVTLKVPIYTWFFFIYLYDESGNP